MSDFDKKLDEHFEKINEKLGGILCMIAANLFDKVVKDLRPPLGDVLKREE